MSYPAQFYYVWQSNDVASLRDERDNREKRGQQRRRDNRDNKKI